MNMQFTKRAADVIEQAHINAIKLKRTYVGTDNILLALVAVSDT